MKRVVGLDAESVSHAERLRMRLISASQEDGVSPTQFFELLDAFLKEEAWEDLGITFPELVGESPPVGMGLVEEDFRKLLTLRHRYENQDEDVRQRMGSVRKRATDLLNPAQPGLGVNQYTGCDIITPSHRGTDPSYTLRRLKRDRPDLAERVMNKELSANAAAIEAGFRDRTFTVSDNLDKAARTLIKHFDPDELYGAMVEAKL